MKFIQIIMLMISIVFSNDIFEIKIVDINGEPLENVFIESIDSNNIINPLGKTDINGFFIIDDYEDSIKSIKFSHIGYSEKVIALSDLNANSN